MTMSAARTATANWDAIPTVSFSGGPTMVNENGTTEQTYSFTATDGDRGDTLAISSGFPKCGTGGSLVGGSASITGSAGSFSGSFKCVFDDGPATPAVQIQFTDGKTAFDGQVFSNTDTKNVTVDNVAPDATFTNNGPINEGSSATVSFSSPSDPSSADTTAGFHYAFDCNGGTLSSATYAGSGTATSTSCSFDDNGSYSVTGRIFDKDGGSTLKTTTVTVNNVAPSVSLSGPTATNEGTTESYSYSFTDPGSADTWTHATSCGADGVKSDDSFSQLSKSGSFKCTWPDNFTGESVAASVTDDEGGIGSDSKSVDIANVAPSASLSGPTAANEGDTKSYSYSWTDPGSADTFPALGNSVSCGANGTPSNAVFNPGSKTGSFDCTWSDDSGAGTSDVSATVTDDDGGVGSDTKHVTVDNVAPNVTPASDQNANAGTSATFLIGSFTDPGADGPWSVTVNWGDASANDTFTESNPGTISARSHTYAAGGTYTVTVTATVAEAGTGTTPSGSATFNVTVAATSTNHAPDVTITAPQSGSLYAKNANVTVTGTYTDPDAGDSHTCKSPGTTTRPRRRTPTPSRAVRRPVPAPGRAS